jgi:two-component system cell cycle sensor histidine kinase/response regulator CckA
MVSGTPKAFGEHWMKVMKTVLIVDDDVSVRCFIHYVLSDTGFTVMTAESAEQALSIIEGNARHIQLVITDMMMPGGSGLDLAVELQRRFPFIHVLYMSGYADSIAMESISRVSPEHVLAKPFTDRALLASVLQVMPRN